MSNLLQYLDRYEQREDKTIFFLKDYPSSHISGNKIVRELAIFLLHDETIQLNQIHKINELEYEYF